MNYDTLLDVNNNYLLPVQGEQESECLVQGQILILSAWIFARFTSLPLLVLLAQAHPTDALHRTSNIIMGVWSATNNVHNNYN